MAIVVAHPDDEVIGIGAQLPRMKNATFIHVTDGSPRNLADAQHAGFSNARDYAKARRKELKAALRIAGIPLAHTIELNFRDQDASLHLREITRRLSEIISRLKPKVILTHPYEGGHPDHDATAFAVHAACASVPRPPSVVEMTSYHRGPGGLVTSQFLPHMDHEIHVIQLTPEEIRLKERLFACFKTQRTMLQLFAIQTERFRLAPSYDFLSAPHPGALFYESLGFGITGRHFRSLVQTALSNKI